MLTDTLGLPLSDEHLDVLQQMVRNGMLQFPPPEGAQTPFASRAGPSAAYAYPSPVGTQQTGYMGSDVHAPASQVHTRGAQPLFPMEQSEGDLAMGGISKSVLINILENVPATQLSRFCPAYQELQSQYQDLKLQNAMLEGEVKGLSSSASRTSDGLVLHSTNSTSTSVFRVPACHESIPSYQRDGVNSQAKRVEIDAAHAADPSRPSSWDMFWERGDRWAVDAPKNKKKGAKNKANKANKPKAPADSDVEEPNASSSSDEGSDSDAEDPTVASTPVRGRAQMKTGKNVHCFYLVDINAAPLRGGTLKDVFASQNIVWEYFIDAGVLPDKFGDMSSTPRVMQDYIGRMRSAWICFCFCAGDWKAIELGEYRFNTFLHNKSSKKSADRRLRLEQGRARYAFQGQHNTLYKLEAADDNEASAPSKKRSKTEPVSESTVDALSESELDYVEDTALSSTPPVPTFVAPVATNLVAPSPVSNVSIPTTTEVVAPTSTPMEIDKVHGPIPDSHHEPLGVRKDMQDVPAAVSVATSAPSRVSDAALDQSPGGATLAAAPATSTPSGQEPIATADPDATPKSTALTAEEKRAKQSAMFANHKGAVPDMIEAARPPPSSAPSSAARAPKKQQAPTESKPKADGRSWNPGSGTKRKAILGHEWKAMEGNAKGTMAEFDAYCEEQGEEKVAKWEADVRKDPAAKARLETRIADAAARKAEKAEKAEKTAKTKKSAAPSAPAASQSGT